MRRSASDSLHNSFKASSSTFSLISKRAMIFPHHCKTEALGFLPSKCLKVWVLEAVRVRISSKINIRMGSMCAIDLYYLLGF